MNPLLLVSLSCSLARRSPVQLCHCCHCCSYCCCSTCCSLEFRASRILAVGGSSLVRRSDLFIGSRESSVAVCQSARVESSSYDHCAAGEVIAQRWLCELPATTCSLSSLTIESICHQPICLSKLSPTQLRLVGTKHERARAREKEKTFPLFLGLVRSSFVVS